MQHWCNATQQPWPKQCCVAGCINPAEVGAHVINSEATGEFIVPVCKSCNARADTFSLKSGTPLASANQQKTCAQW